MNVELSKIEAELQTEESNLHAELSRVALQGSELQVKLKAFAARAAKSAKKPSRKPGAVPEVDADAAFERATMAREAAARTRKEVAGQVRTQLATLKAQLKALSTQLAEDEKSLDEAEEIAARSEPAPKPATPPGLGPMLSRKPGVAARPVKGKAGSPPAPPTDEGSTDEAITGTNIEFALSALPDEKTLMIGRAEKAVAEKLADEEIEQLKAKPVEKMAEKPRPIGKISPPEKDKKPVRISPRVAMQASIDFGSDDNFYNGFSSNISDGGVFIATVNVKPLGTEVDLSFSLPTGAKIEAKGVVRWVREVNDKIPDSFPGMGVEFRGLAASAQQSINDFIAQREPLFYAEAA